LTLKGKLRFNAVQKAGDYNVAGAADAALASMQPATTDTPHPVS
jgi:hypothetical protein